MEGGYRDSHAESESGRGQATRSLKGEEAISSEHEEIEQSEDYKRWLEEYDRPGDNEILGPMDRAANNSIVDLNDLFVIDSKGDPNVFERESTPRGKRPKNTYPVFTPTFSPQTDEIRMSYQEASRNFGSRKIGKSKNNRKKKETIDIFSTASYKSSQPQMSDDEAQDKEDMNDYFENITDGMTPEEIDEYLRVSSIRLSDESFGEEEDIDSIDSDDYWNGESDDFLSDSEDEIKFKAGGGKSVTASGSKSSVPSKSELKKQRKKQDRETRQKKRNQLNQTLDKGKKIQQNLYRDSKKGPKYEEEVYNLITKTNKDIRDYVERADSDSFIIPPLPSGVRNFVRKLATFYNLKPKIRGNNQQKMLVLYLTQNSSIPYNWREFPEELVGKFGISSLNPHSRPPKPTFKTSNKAGASHSQATLKVGDVVGITADPISTSNVGHKMLLAMGWKTGQGLGRAEGIADPIDVVIRGKRTGLGA